MQLRMGVIPRLPNKQYIEIHAKQGQKVVHKNVS